MTSSVWNWQAAAWDSPHWLIFRSPNCSCGMVFTVLSWIRRNAGNCRLFFQGRRGGSSPNDDLSIQSCWPKRFRWEWTEVIRAKIFSSRCPSAWTWTWSIWCGPRNSRSSVLYDTVMCLKSGTTRPPLIVVAYMTDLLRLVKKKKRRVGVTYHLPDENTLCIRLYLKHGVMC